MNLIRPYVKVVDLVNDYGIVAIYEPNPFRPEAILGAFQKSCKKPGKVINLGNPIEDESWCWVYYDWCGNPIGLGRDVPEGRLTYKLKVGDFEGWYTEADEQRFVEYFNKEPNQKMKKEWEKKYGKH